MLGLLSPLRWAGTLVSFLPLHLWQTIDAVGGYLIGIPRTCFNMAIEHCEMRDKVLVDLDNKTLLAGELANPTPLPPCLAEFLRQQLTPLVLAKNDFRLAVQLKIIMLRVVASLLGCSLGCRDPAFWLSQLPHADPFAR